ncbi:hypothetical protein [Vibrio owensii]|uniref:hypothetical protein n=1 Tax=Vibrio owensii TaxID=696485 RepID=UPI0018F16770|nr:hypothetical protein [Vibrio owensii]
MNDYDFREDNEALDKLDSIATKSGVDSKLLVDVTSYISRQMKQAIENGETVDSTFVEKCLVSYDKQAKAFYERATNDENAQKALADYAYETIKAGVYCINLFGRKLDGFYPNSGFFSKAETLCFSDKGFMTGSKDEMTAYLERCITECKKVFEDSKTTLKQRNVAQDCLKTLDRCEIHLS